MDCTSIRFKNGDGTWGPLIDLKGDTGDKGDQGVRGPTGEGLEGVQGVPGVTKFTWIKYADFNSYC